MGIFQLNWISLLTNFTYYLFHCKTRKWRLLVAALWRLWASQWWHQVFFCFPGTNTKPNNNKHHRCLLNEWVNEEEMNMLSQLNCEWNSSIVMNIFNFYFRNLMVFLVVMYRCESWTIKKAECQNAFELWYWRRLLRVPWRARRSN